MHGLLIYMYLKDGRKKLPQNSPEGVVYRGGGIHPPPQGLTLQNIARVSRVKIVNKVIDLGEHYIISEFSRQ